MSGLEAGPSGQASEGRAQGGAFSYGRLPEVQAQVTPGQEAYWEPFPVIPEGPWPSRGTAAFF